MNKISILSGVSGQSWKYSLIELEKVEIFSYVINGHRHSGLILAQILLTLL